MLGESFYGERFAVSGGYLIVLLAIGVAGLIARHLHPDRRGLAASQASWLLAPVRLGPVPVLTRAELVYRRRVCDGVVP
ncbi:hypothetical protein [Actinoplanes sp. TFC3]|uniref:hypothetical protein n=1 Tax=Actinoplanes sp. TFC3 TaxID=1710355 RepID=UPI000830A4C7|nr:hypothetical protein [Actinoplanes sp. TFC3]